MMGFSETKILQFLGTLKGTAAGGFSALQGQPGGEAALAPCPAATTPSAPQDLPDQFSSCASAENSVRIGKEAVSEVLEMCAADPALASHFASLALQMKGKIEQIRATADLDAAAAVPFQRLQDGLGNSLKRMRASFEAPLQPGRNLHPAQRAPPWKAATRPKPTLQQQIDAAVRKENQPPPLGSRAGSRAKNGALQVRLTIASPAPD